MKKFFHKSLSVILTLTMASSMTAVAITSTNAAVLENNAVGEQNPSDSKGKTFSLDEVYTDYLFPQTDKTSEVKYEGTVENNVLNANDDSVYADFHFSQVQKDNEASSGSGKSMSDNAKDLLNDKDSSNPLEGLSVVNPDEFLLVSSKKQKKINFFYQWGTFSKIPHVTSL